ncbi:chromate transporter [Odoribacter sp. OttesenSCG-928-J03]|nr:chromate transporter [Odoribacter sp. OttesenSCG-928-J03]MDL2283177.1 chromate transporter [Odoribacter sp. OttesenSCG-928-G04]MDL2331124.1 chromate transporter [Odoribacter sp. OttesenSCG-928-A06]
MVLRRVPLRTVPDGSKIGLFGFGGGYAMLSLVQNEVVVNHQWISVSDFTDIVAISQTTPGPIAFNTATYIGYTATGTVWGSVIATVAVSIPSIVFMTIVSKLFFKFKHNPYVGAVMKLLKPALIGLIAAATIMLINSTNFPDYVSWIIFAGVFLASLKRVDPILLIVFSGVVGYLVY